MGRARNEGTSDTRSRTRIAIALVLVATTARAGDFAGDFDGDGFDDLVVGVPNESVGTLGSAGIVQVLYGSQNGPSPAGSQLWRQGSGGVPGAAEAGDRFGASWAAGDFDGDGIDDLAIGVPGEDALAGAVVVLYGTPLDGLAAGGAQLWTQDTAGIQDLAEAGDEFGKALAAGDFNGDGFDDLAIGVPDEDLTSITDEGAVHVLLGGNGGLFSFLNGFWHQDVSGVLEQVDGPDGFGSALAAGDFDGDGFDDLAVGIPFETIESASSGTRAGAVQVLFGASGAALTSRDQFFSQSSTNVAGSPELNDHFGAVLAAGEISEDSRDDLLIGAPDEDIGTQQDAGAVVQLLGGAGGLTVPSFDWMDQSIGETPDDPEASDRFGASIAIGDFNGDGRNDVAIGVPGERIGSAPRAGAVVLYPGRIGGVVHVGSLLVSQDTPGFSHVAETDEFFGASVQAGDYGEGARAELAIGVPGHSQVASSDGLVQVPFFPTTLFSSGVSGTFDQILMQNTVGVADACEALDRFGAVLQGG